MSLSINTNTAAMAALQSLNQTTADLTKTENTVSTGKSVNTASDNPAMYSIAQNMTAQISTLSGVSTGLSFSAQVLNTATTGLSSISSALQSLATTIGTNTTGVDNSTLNDAITKTLASIDSAATGAKFQGVNLLSGATGNGTTYTSLSTAMDAQGSTFTQNGFNVTSAGLGLTNLSMDMSGSSLALGSSTTSNTFATNNVIQLENVAAAGTDGTISATNPAITYNFIANSTSNDTQTTALNQVGRAIGLQDGDLTIGNSGLLSSSSGSIVSHTTASDGSVTYALGNGESIVQSKDGNGNSVYTANTAFDSNGNVTAKSVITDVNMTSAASLSSSGGSSSAQSVKQVDLMTQAMEYQGFGVSRDASNNLTIAGNSISATNTQMGTLGATGQTLALGASTSAQAFATNNTISVGNGVTAGTATNPAVTNDFYANTTGSSDTNALNMIGVTAGLATDTLTLSGGKLTSTDTTYTLAAGQTQADGSTAYTLTKTADGTAAGTISQATDANGNSVYTFTSADSKTKTVMTDVDMSSTSSLSTTNGMASEQSAANIKLMQQAIADQGYDSSVDANNNLTIASSTISQGATAAAGTYTAATGSGAAATTNSTVQMFSRGTTSGDFKGVSTAVTGASVVSAVVQAAISSVTRTASSIGYSSTTISNLQTTTSSLSDALTTGVGALTDADLAAESAKLTSLQTKQQLAVQSLSIANSQSSTLLSLFRG